MSGQAVPDIVEKTMSASAAEFHRSMAALDVGLAPDLTHSLRCGDGTVAITYAALPGVTLGSLLALPRARITLHFHGVSQPDRAAFMARFDLAFQRGGG